MGDAVSRQAALDDIETVDPSMLLDVNWVKNWVKALPSVQPEVIRCKGCKHNPKDEWFGCPMSHLDEKQRPETAWCWKSERRTDETDRC